MKVVDTTPAAHGAATNVWKEAMIATCLASGASAFRRISMPVYESICQECHKSFEVVRPMSEVSKSVACPHCGSTNVQRSWSSVFAVTSKKS